MKTLFSAVGAAGLVSMLLTGQSLADTPLKDRYAALYAEAAKEGTVVYYTPGKLDENQKFLDLWSANFPDVKIDFVSKLSSALITDIQTQNAAGTIQADVVSLSQAYVAAQWKQRGIYEQYKTASLSKLAPRWADPDGAFYTYGAVLLTAAYNTKVFPNKDELPKNLAGFLDPKWKSQIVFSHPETASSNLTYLLAMLQLGKITWPTLEKFAGQDILFVPGNAEATRIIAAGERPLSFMNSSQNVLSARDKGQAVDYYVLEDGVLTQERVSGILKKAPHPAAAKLLLEAITSPEGEQALAEGGSLWPTHPDAAVPEGLPKLADLNLLEVNLQSLADDQKIAEFLKHFDTVFGRE
jgi:iron(III) transport system substrate-binding protein